MIMPIIHLMFGSYIILEILELKDVLRQKDGLYMLVLLASPRWRWCPCEYLLVPYGFRFCMEPANFRLDTSAIWEKLIKPTYRSHLFDEVSTSLSVIYFLHQTNKISSDVSVY